MSWTRLLRTSRFSINTDGAKAGALKTGLQIGVSGCVNVRSHHHVFDVGVIGINKAGTEAWWRGGEGVRGKQKVVGFVARYASAVKSLRKGSFESAYRCFSRSFKRLNKVQLRTFFGSS
ncbi:MAG: hypothetical protein ACKESB_00380 [Candidatus Hodgkinia cicadicola]